MGGVKTKSQAKKKVHFADEKKRNTDPLMKIKKKAEDGRDFKLPMWLGYGSGLFSYQWIRNEEGQFLQETTELVHLNSG